MTKERILMHFSTWSSPFSHWYGHTEKGTFRFFGTLSELIPYFFANNNVNNARWLPIHLRDMLCLEKQHPEVAKEFHAGNSVVHKSGRNFSAVAIDQAHEQNVVIKGDGGAIGLTEDPSAATSHQPLRGRSLKM